MSYEIFFKIFEGPQRLFSIFFFFLIGIFYYRKMKNVGRRFANISLWGSVVCLNIKLPSLI